ncbi:MAG: hypothetical protein Q9190_006013, partial [Brigantiaea leucoxantha]
MELARPLLTPDKYGRMPSAYTTSTRTCAVREYLLKMEATVVPEWHPGIDDSPFRGNRTFDTEVDKGISLPKTWAGTSAVFHQDM